MIKLNRTTEYGLIALRHIGRKRLQDPRAVTSAREIADTYGLPFEITAKTLQRLKERGLIHSEQGARGGYLLQRSLEQVSLGDFLNMMEGSQAVVPCASSHAAAVTTGPSGADGVADKAADKSADKVGDQGCEYSGKCEMRGLMTDLNSRVWNFLSGIRLSELAGMPSVGNNTFAASFPLPGSFSGALAGSTSRLGDEP